ncbi:hypothetical protein HC928_00435 [bacterium]|nr:hypothetical protein [bacterium]
MTIGYKRIHNSYGEPIQQSLTVEGRDHTPLNTTKAVLGVILEVHPADSDSNRSAFQRDDRRGYLHTATVLIVQDGRGSYFTLENVIITPDAACGLDDYYEHLPRPSTVQVNGQTFNSQLNRIDPYTLDGDWCVVSFLGGNLDQPFILRWWPHSRNPFDAGTSGSRNPNSQNSQQTLNQVRRMLRRINGVEFIVSKTGNLYISTHLANSTLNFGETTTPEEGRWPRTKSEDEGGSVKLWVKPSQSFEIDWNPPVDGIGVLDDPEDDLPQTNPRVNSSSRQEKADTYVLMDKDRFDLEVPERINLISKQRILLQSEENTTIDVSSTLDIDAQSVTIDTSSDLEITVTGSTSITGTGPVSIEGTTTLDLTSTGSTNISSSGALTLGGATVSIGTGTSSGTPGSISVDPAGISLGNGALGGAVGGTQLVTLFAAFQTAVAAAAALATVDAAAFNALSAAVAALTAGIPGTVSSTTRVG